MKEYFIQKINTIEANQYDSIIFSPNIERRSFRSVENIRNEYGIKLYAFVFDNYYQSEYEKFFYRINQFEKKTYINYIMTTDDSFVRDFRNNVNLKDGRMCVDMTGFSIPQIYQIINIIYCYCELNEIDIIYSEPLHYKYKGGIYTEYHPEVERICRPIRGYQYSGDSEKETLVIILGFDKGLSYLVYSCIAEEPSFTTYAINGLPSYTIKDKDVSLLNNRELISHIGYSSIFSASASNPFSVYNTLVDIRKLDKETLLNICPICSKPMALGACLFAKEQGDNIKTIYPHYSKKTFDYDEKPGVMWRYRIQFYR